MQYANLLLGLIRSVYMRRKGLYSQLIRDQADFHPSSTTLLEQSAPL